MKYFEILATPLYNNTFKSLTFSTLKPKYTKSVYNQVRNHAETPFVFCDKTPEIVTHIQSTPSMKCATRFGEFTGPKPNEFVV
ncbi:MAG TPA: hypothetical protein DCR93_02325 [Cytophagales bacterium]|nr:hypothetical protein [Cytophagales bacterium]HAP58386.1 hypothetical protein [Cytophagales bacterium]